MEKRMELAKESKTVVRLRRKLKKRLRAESKVIKKRDLKKISELIRLRFNKQALDLQKTTLQQASTTIQKVRATVIQNSDHIHMVTKDLLLL